MSEEQIEQPVVAPRKPRSKRAQVDVEVPQFVDLLVATDDKDDYEIIRLHDNDEIIGHHPFGVNGRFFHLQANVWYKVPGWLLSTIDSCVTSRPVLDEYLRVVGHRQMKRFPYETFRG